MPDQPLPTYWDYLRLDKMLGLQGGVEGDEGALLPDELHFIVVHQTFELWFKLVLRELRLGRDSLGAPKMPEEQVPVVVHHLRRINEILKLMVDQFRVMETLTPQDFLAFRDKLSTASGFQSFQMRELEILLGLREDARVKWGGLDPVEQFRAGANGSPAGRLAWDRIEAARKEKTFREALHDWLYRTPIHGSAPSDPHDDAEVAEFLTDYLTAVESHQDEQVRVLAKAGAAPEAMLRQRFDESRAAARQFLLAEDEPEDEQARARRVRAGLLFIES